jgi:putative flavoprotein involved in K+ transport
MKKNYEIVVIGAGQAGLAMGYFLQQQKRKTFVLIDANKRVGESWRNRYNSLVLFTPKKYSELPGLTFPGNPNSFPTKDETADYLENYANHFSLPIHFDTKVLSLEKKNKRFIISTSQGTYVASKVVVATGPFQKSLFPTIANELSPTILQLHSSDYRNPAQLKEGNVLVVGGGNSGAQIAFELAAYKQTFLSISYPISFMPLQLWGKSIFWYFEKLGMIKADVHSKKGRWLQQQKEKVYGLELKKRLEKGEVIQKPRLVSAFNGDPKFADETSLTIQNIIWATGFQMDFNWIHIDGVVNNQGQPIHRKGISPIENLFFLGLPWLSCRGSSLVGWVGLDAERVASYLHIK